MTRQTPGLRDSIKRNLAEIVALHEEILDELNRLVPYLGPSQFEVPAASRFPSIQLRRKAHTHRRWRSLDAVPEDENIHYSALEEPDALADPQLAAAVARIFGKRMSRFFVYKEYGAKYEMMAADIAMASAGVPEWESFRNGLEALALTVGSARRYLHASKKSSTLGDLVIKKLDAVARNQIRSYGRIQLCGALHVTWQSGGQVKGQHMICLLYEQVLCLATAGKADPIYTIMACIDLDGARIKNSLNQPGEFDLRRGTAATAGF
ncbi:RhoGEF domain [Geosmithia morbida]|uniref:RhoGEF domain n=1 Tax=Geosmithia morbida TaxID=1094350 RepID=A0A9P4YT16_9HYPO|nr:RhoGEF domain [Geosmithia morbida]KAF4122586.1 RhoGEF domain [Geosmithia morbida]